MWKVVRAFTVTSEDQEDLLQEIAVQLWRSLPAFRGDAKESTWIYRVAFNTALVWKRDEKRRGETRKIFRIERRAGNLAGATGQTHDDDLVQQLYTAIRQLPKLDASLALMHLDGLSYREMSEVLGITESNVGVKLNRIRKQLAEMLKGAGMNLDDFQKSWQSQDAAPKISINADVLLNEVRRNQVVIPHRQFLRATCAKSPSPRC